MHAIAKATLSKSTGSSVGVELLGRGGAMWEREFEVLGDQLLDVWPSDIFG